MMDGQGDGGGGGGGHPIPIALWKKLLLIAGVGYSGGRDDSEARSLLHLLAMGRQNLFRLKGEYVHIPVVPCG